MKVGAKHYRSIWFDDATQTVQIIDQRWLPHEFRVVALKTLNDNKTIIIERVRNTAIVIENTERVRRERRARVRLDDDVRIREGIAERCSKCERVVCKRPDQANGVGINIKSHKERDICSNIYSAKRIALKVGVADLAPYLNVINIIRKWAIATNRPIFYE